VIPVNISAGDQFKPEFLDISPNNKMPAIADPEGPDAKAIALFESGAILLYLADKTGRFIPSDSRDRYTVVQWLMFQMGGVGPMLGQAHHFRQYAPEQIPYAIAIRMRQVACIAYSTNALVKWSMLPVITPLQTWQSFPGFCPMNDRDKI
jgi:glutathione S-transferase